MSKTGDGSAHGPKPVVIGGKLEELVRVEVLERAAGTIVLASDFDLQHLNAAGAVHGGFVSALLDVALCAAATSTESGGEGKYGVTLSLTVNFVRPLTSGRALCSATVSGGGKRTQFVEGRIYRAGERGEAAPFATATATVRVIDIR